MSDAEKLAVTIGARTPGEGLIRHLYDAPIPAPSAAQGFEATAIAVELWAGRMAENVADFLSGIWAQGYGQIYNDGIAWLMRIRTATRIALLAALALMGAMVVRSHCPGLSGVADGDLDHRRLGAGDQAE